MRTVTAPWVALATRLEGINMIVKERWGASEVYGGLRARCLYWLTGGIFRPSDTRERAGYHPNFRGEQRHNVSSSI